MSTVTEEVHAAAGTSQTRSCACGARIVGRGYVNTTSPPTAPDGPLLCWSCAVAVVFLTARRMTVVQLASGDQVDLKPAPAGPNRWVTVTCVQSCPLREHRPGCVAVGLDYAGSAHVHEPLCCARSGLHRQADAMLLTRRPVGGAR